MSLKTITAGLLALTLASPALAAPPAWEVIDEDSRVVLFPTIHLLLEGVDWKSDAVRAEIDAAEEVWFEIADATSPEAVAKIQALVAKEGMSPDTPLSSQLSPEQLEDLKAVLADLGAPLEAIDPMRPWMAATALTAANLARSGFSGENGVEKVLGDAYGERPRRGLETADFQVSVLAGMGGDNEIAFLMNAIDGLDDAGPTMQRVAEAWSKGDVDLIETELLDEMRRDYPDVFEAMFTDRNRNWAEIIDAELQGSGTDFIAVGAGHLIGEGSVQDFLEDKGYTVRRIELAN